MVERLVLSPLLVWKGAVCYCMLIVLYVTVCYFCIVCFARVFLLLLLLMSVHVILPLNVCMLPCCLVSPRPLPINVSMFVFMNAFATV